MKIPLNTTADGTAMTLKANYARMSYANFAKRNGGGRMATGVINVYEEIVS